MTNDLLEQIVRRTRLWVAERREARPRPVIEREAAGRVPRAEAFRQALRATGKVNVIAECKRRSPLKGLLREAYDPAALAQAYERGGAAAISVLTEPEFFDGAIEHLTDVREAVAVPVLRKDFVVDEYQLIEARAAGADAVLLIVAVLGDRLPAVVREATGCGLAALVEVHDELELRRALDAGADIVGVNSRDLRTMTVRQETSVKLAAVMPAHIIAVAESGIASAADVAGLQALGYSAFLIGERLVRSADPEQTLRELVANEGARPSHEAPGTSHDASRTSHPPSLAPETGELRRGRRETGKAQW